MSRRVLFLFAVLLVGLLEVAPAYASTRLAQSYLPKSYTWASRSIQAASVERPGMLAFLHAHPRVKVFSGFRAGTYGDHRCGLAVDIVPIDGATDRGYAVLKYVAADAIRRGYAYVEPLSQTWLPDNHHLHISFKRCPT